MAPKALDKSLGKEFLFGTFPRGNLWGSGFSSEPIPNPWQHPSCQPGDSTKNPASSFSFGIGRHRLSGDCSELIRILISMPKMLSKRKVRFNLGEKHSLAQVGSNTCP